MDDNEKKSCSSFIWGIVTAIIVGVIGFYLGAHRINKLQENLDDIYKKVGAIERQTVELQEKAENIGRTIAETESAVDNFQKSDPVKIGKVVEILNNSSETKNLIERLATVEASLKKDVLHGPVEVKYVSQTGEGYMRYNAPKGWVVLGAGGWSSGGTPMSVRYHYRDCDVVAWAAKPNVDGHFLTVVIAKIGNEK